MMNNNDDLQNDNNENFSVAGCVAGVLLIGFILVCLIMLFWLGPLLFCILLIPILALLTIFVSLIGLVTGRPEDRWEFPIPLAASLSILSVVIHSSFSSVFDEED